MDISSHLLSSDRDFHSPSQTCTDHIGWDKTQSHKVSPDIACKIKELVTCQVKKVAESPGFDLVAKKAEKSGHQVQFLPHSDIELGSLIGEGGFSRIFELHSLKQEETTTTTNESLGDNDDSTSWDYDYHPHNEEHRYVVKVLRPDLAHDCGRFALCAWDIVNEALIMAALDHPHILKVRAVSEGGIAAFERGRSPDAFFMVLKQLDESLEDRLHHSWKIQFRTIRLRPRDRAMFFRERYKIVVAIADALVYMHSLGIIHRDLKPQNIGFDSQGTLKVFDFGSARLIPASNYPNETFRLSQQAGTVRYISPENYLGQPYNLKSDVYSFTILMHEILSLQTPRICFTEDPKQGTVHWNPNLRPTIPLRWPRPIRRLLQRGWAQESSKRPTMQEVHGTLHQELEQLIE